MRALAETLKVGFYTYLCISLVGAVDQSVMCVTYRNISQFLTACVCWFVTVAVFASFSAYIGFGIEIQVRDILVNINVVSNRNEFARNASFSLLPEMQNLASRKCTIQLELLISGNYMQS